MKQLPLTPLSALAALALAIAVPAAAAASSITFDASLVSPASSGPNPGFYNGSGGNPNGGFTIDTENGIEIGLRAKLRQDPTVIDTPNNVYDVPTGPEPSSPTHAAWNYEFSIDVGPGGDVSGLTLGDITATLLIQDLTQGTSATVDPLTYWTDDSTWGTAGKASPDGTVLTNWGAQNSENPIFGDFPLAVGFNENLNDYYRFTLTVNNQAGELLASDSIDVAVGDATIPEPGSLLLLGSGLAGLVAAARRRKTRP